MTTPNYYAILGVESSATVDELRSALRSTRNQWASRASHPDPDIRSESERNVRLCSEAEQVLFDPAKRAAYDEQLRRQPVQSPVAQFGQPSDASGWLAQAKAYADQGMWSQARHAAGIATENEPGNAEAWQSKGRYANNMKQFDEAEHCFNQAMMLAPTEAFYTLVLVDFYLDRERTTEAARCLDFAQGQGGRSPFIAWWLAEASRRLERWEVSVDFAKEAADAEPANDTFRSELALCTLFKTWEQQLDPIETVPGQEWFEHIRATLQYVNDLKATDPRVATVSTEFRAVITRKIVALATEGWRGNDRTGWHIISEEQINRAAFAVAGLRHLGLDRTSGEVAEVERALQSAQEVSTHDVGGAIGFSIKVGIAAILGLVILIAMSGGKPVHGVVLGLLVFVGTLWVKLASNKMPLWEWRAKKLL